MGWKFRADVEHEAAVAEARRVHHGQRAEGQALFRSGSGGQQAAQRLQAVEDAGGGGADDADAPRIHHQLVGFRRGLSLDPAHGELQLRGAGGRVEVPHGWL